MGDAAKTESRQALVSGLGCRTNSLGDQRNALDHCGPDPGRDSFAPVGEIKRIDGLKDLSWGESQYRYLLVMRLHARKNARRIPQGWAVSASWEKGSGALCQHNCLTTCESTLKTQRLRGICRVSFPQVRHHMSQFAHIAV